LKEKLMLSALGEELRNDNCPQLSGNITSQRQAPPQKMRQHFLELFWLLFLKKVTRIPNTVFTTQKGKELRKHDSTGI